MSGQIVNRGGPEDRNSIPLVTTKRNFIRNERPPAWAKERIEASTNIWKSKIPEAIFRSYGEYNCAGLIFASRRTWIELAELELIFRDDGYFQLAGPQEAKIGDLILYFRSGEPSHI